MMMSWTLFKCLLKLFFQGKHDLRLIEIEKNLAEEKRGKYLEEIQRRKLLLNK